MYIWGFPGGSDGKESACNAGDLGLIRLGRSLGEGNGYPLQYFFWLADYSPWGSDLTQTNTYTYISGTTCCIQKLYLLILYHEHFPMSIVLKIFLIAIWQTIVYLQYI